MHRPYRQPSRGCGRRGPPAVAPLPWHCPTWHCPTWHCPRVLLSPPPHPPSLAGTAQHTWTTARRFRAQQPPHKVVLPNASHGIESTTNPHQLPSVPSLSLTRARREAPTSAQRRRQASHGNSLCTLCHSLPLRVVTASAERAAVTTSSRAIAHARWRKRQRLSRSFLFCRAREAASRAAAAWALHCVGTEWFSR